MNGIIVVLIAVVLLLIGTYIWKKGNKKEPFWESLFEVIGNIFVWEIACFLYIKGVGSVFVVDWNYSDDNLFNC